jgi:hypothetical protein
VPLILVNGRMSERSARGWGRTPAVARGEALRLLPALGEAERDPRQQRAGDRRGAPPAAGRLDAPRYVARFLDHWQPDLALVAESELWPNTILALHARGVPRQQFGRGAGAGGDENREAAPGQPLDEAEERQGLADAGAVGPDHAYHYGLIAGEPALAGLLAWRRRRGKEDPVRLPERLIGPRPPCRYGPCGYGPDRSGRPARRPGHGLR